MQPEVYLDHAATTPGLPPVAEAMAQAMLAVYGNPSSLHRKGIEAEAILKKTRERIAASMRVSPAEIVFTSGGTEGNALAIRGRPRPGKGEAGISSPVRSSTPPSSTSAVPWRKKDIRSHTYRLTIRAGSIRTGPLRS